MAKRATAEATFYPRDFERISIGLMRLRVPGGWMVLSRDSDANEGRWGTETMAFLPDPNHVWTFAPEGSRVR